MTTQSNINCTLVTCKRHKAKWKEHQIASLIAFVTFNCTQDNSQAFPNLGFGAIDSADNQVMRSQTW